MTLLLRTTLFLTGAYLGLRGLAAAYRALDLWYAIRREYPRVVRGVVVWWGASAVVLALTEAPERSAFLWGLLAYLLFYVSPFGLRHLVLRRPPPPATVKAPRPPS
jgi:hypothetical protein